MKKLELLLFLFVLMGCGIDPKELDAVKAIKESFAEKADSLSVVVTEQNALIAELRDSISILKYPADQRLEQAKRYISEEEYDKALKELKELKKVFPNSSEAQSYESLVESINKKKEEKRKEEERIRALGFKALPQCLNVEIGYNKIAISGISVGNTFSFDDYGSSYYYRTADRGSKYISMSMSVTSTDHDPNLPQLALYTINADKMKLAGTFQTEFARWSDYGAYLGNYHDTRNDFAKVSTVKFKLGLQVDDETLQGPYAIIVKKENGLTSSYNRYEEPPISYIGSVSYPNTLTIDNFSNEYVLIKLTNL